MIAANLHTALYAGLSPLFEIDPEPMPDGGTRLFTPFMFQDGTMGVMFVSLNDGRYILTDGGETLGWLWQLTGGDDLSAEQQYLLDKICRSALGVTYHKGELMLRCDRPEDLADAVFRLGQAMLRVSDLWFLSPYSTVGMRYNAPDDTPPPPATLPTTTAKGIAV